MEKEAGGQVMIKLGEMYGKFVLVMALHRLMHAIGYGSMYLGDKERRTGTANTAMIQHARKTFALTESDYPY